MQTPSTNKPFAAPLTSLGSVYRAPVEQRTRSFLESIDGVASFALLALMLWSAAWTVSYSWAAKSNASAFPLFRASESCRLPLSTSADSVRQGACRLESAIVVGAGVSYRRQKYYYSVNSQFPDGTRELTSLLMPLDQAFWSRTRVGRHVKVQRFIAPGFHITGKVTALIDSDAFALTRYHPDSGTHNESFRARVGVLLFGISFGLFVMLRRALP